MNPTFPPSPAPKIRTHATRRPRRLRAILEGLEPRLTPAGGTIGGVIFNDLNGDGVQGGGEPGISGRTVFLDLNRDNLLDNGEPATTTGTDGSYQFTGLAAGTYLVGQVVPPGWKATAPTGAAPGERTVTLAAGSPYTFTFNGLASASDQTIPTYHENGYTFTTNVQQPGQFTVYGSSDTARYAGSPALSAEWAPSTITLSRDDGTPFTLNSMDLSTIWSSVYSVTVSFTGHRADGTTVQQSFPIGSQLGFHAATFTGFTNLTSVTWNSTGYNDYHQFDNVAVAGGGATSASGVNFGTQAVNTGPPVANDDAYSVNENTALTTANPLATSLTMSSQPGDYIGQGRSYSFTPANGPFTASSDGNGNHVGFAFHTPSYSEWWYVDFAAPNGARLTPGTYTNAARYPFQAANQPGLNVDGDGRGSNTLTGSFTVTQAVYDASGNVLSFAASFVQHSEGATPALTGTINYQAPNAPPPGVLANDTDPAGLALTAQVVTGPAHGSLSLNSDGTFTYTPATNYFGPDSFTYAASDGQQVSVPATVNLTVNHVNQPPVAVNSSFAATKNQPLVVAAPGVLAGATDPDPGTTLTARLLAAPAHGSVTLNADGSFTYTPAANYLGGDSFTFAANDGQLNSNAATVGLVVSGPDDPPVARDDSYLVAQDGVLKVGSPGVLSNDGDPNGQPITAALVSGPVHGALTLNADGSFTYTPIAGYHGADSFTYDASDGQLLSNVATVAIVVDAPPVAVAESFATTEDVALTVPAPGVLANDTDADPGDTLRPVLALAPAHGTLTLNADGSLTYTPSLHYSGTDSFRYYVTDGKFSSSAVTDTISVAFVNYAPVAKDDSYAMAEGGSLTTVAAVTSFDAQSDPGDYLGLGKTYHYDASGATYVASHRTGDNSIYVHVIPPGGADDWTLEFAAPNGALLTPGVYNGAVRYPFQGAGQPGLSVTVYDRGSNTLTGTFTVNQATYDPQGKLLQFDASFLMHNEGLTPALSGRIRYNATAGQPGVLWNDSDVENEPMTAQLVSGPAHGSVSLNADGTFTYTPAPLFYGTDSFTYQANDGAGVSNVATATIAVAHVNHAPTAVADAYRVGENQSLAVAAPGVLGNDTDLDGDPIRALLVAGPAHGALTLNADGSFTYTPAAGYAGLDSFQYKPNDGQADGNTVTDTIVVSAPPVASGGSISVASNGSAAVTLAASDPENDPLTYAVVSGPAHGTLSGSGPNLVYTPAANYYGPDSFLFLANDGASDSNPATVTIAVVATPVIAWPSPADIVFGTALGASQLDASATFAGSVVPGTFTYAPAPGAVLGAGANQVLTVTFTPADTVDFASAAGSTTINVLKATPMLAWANPGGIVYGTPLGAAQLDATAGVPGTFTYAPAAGTVLHAGAGQALAVSFRPDDAADYNPASAIATIDVAQAAPAFDSLAAPTIVYGSATARVSGHIAAGSLVPGGSVSIGVGGASVSAAIDPATGDFAADLPTAALGASPSPYAITYAYVGSGDFTAAAATAGLTVNKANQVITWNTPPDIVYGTALGASQLDATVSLPGPDPNAGALTYSVPAGTVLRAGAGQVLTVTAAATANYNAATASVAINVLKADPTVAWAIPASIVYGTPLGAAQLDATANVPGAFAYTPAAGTVLGAGSNRPLSAVFTPADTADYNAVTVATSITVTKAHLTVTAASKDMGHGDAVPALTYTIAGFVNGDTSQAVTGSPALGTSATSTSSAGTYPVTASAGSLSAANYDFAFAPGTVTVHPKILDIRVHWGSQSMSLLGLGRDLPFIDIQAIDVLFSDDVNVAASDLSLRSTVGSGRSYGFGGFSYSASGKDATWTLPSAIGIDRLLLALDNKFGAAVNPSISVWNNNPVAFAVLPGDINGDGVVNNTDYQGVKNDVGLMVIWADVDGNGVVNNTDVNAVKRRIGTRLP